MKTHCETGDPGCSGVILKSFCSAASFWKLETFITPLSGNKFNNNNSTLLSRCIHFTQRLAALAFNLNIPKRKDVVLNYF